MADKQRAFEILEELESRGALPSGGAELLGVMRDSGKYTSKRNEDLKRIENAIRSVKDPHALTDDELRGLANAYTRMKFGVSNDPDGRRRYNENKPMSGRDYFKRVANEIDPNRYADEFPNQLGAYGKMSRDEQLAWADKKIKDQRTLSQKLGMAKFDDPKYIELTERTPREQDELIELGRGIALRESYVPMRKFMESKLGRNRFALDTARKAVETGRLSIDALNIMSKEEAGFVSSYVSQFRPYDTKQGFFPAIGEATRRVVVGTLDSGEKFGKFIAGFGVDASLGLYENWNPIDGASFAEEFRRVKSLKRQSEAATAWKAAPRNRFGTAVMGLADTIPFMIEVMASPATAIVAAGSVAEETRTRLMDMEGVDPTSARVAGVFSGATAVLVERLTGFAGRGKLAEALSKSVITKTASKRLSMQLMNVLARGGEKFIRTGTGEIFEEGIEGFVNSIIEDLSKHELPSVRNATAELIDQMDASKDVIALMSALGLMGRAVTSPFRQPISQSGAEVDVNNRSLQRFSENIANEIESDPEMARQAAEDINRLIIDTWVSEPNKTVAKERLEEAGVTVDEELTKQLEQIESNILTSEEIDVEEQLAEFQAIEQDEATRVERAEAAQAEAARLRDMGFNAKAASILSGEAALAEGASGQFRESGAIEILEGAIDAKKVGGHEEFHGAVAFGVLTDAEIKILKDSLKQDELNAVARKYAEDVLAGRETNLEEEALADRYGEWRSLGAQEKTIMRKAMDFFARLANWVKGRGFKNAEDVFSSIEGRLRERLAEGATLEGDGASFAREGGSIAQRHIDKVVPIWQELLDDAPTDYNIKMVNEQLAEIKRFVEKNLDASVELNIVDGEIVVKLDNSGAPTYDTDGYDEDVFGKETEDISHLPDAAQKILKTARLVSKRFGVDLVYLTGGDRSIHGVSSQDPNGSIGLNIDRFDGVDDIREASSILGKVAHELVHKFIRRDASLLGRMKSYAYKIGADLQMKKAVSAVAFSGKYSDSQIEEEGIIRFYQDGMSSMEFWDRLSKEDAGLANALANFISKVLLTVEEITRRIFRMPGQVEFEQPPIENSIDLMVSEFQKQLVPAEASSASFAREGASVASERDASTLLALAMLKNPNASRADLLAEVNAIDPNLDYDFVKAQADAILADAQNRFNKKLDALTRVDVRRAGAALRRKARATAIRRQGFLEGERLAQVRARQAEKERKRKAQITASGRRKAKRVGTEAAKNIEFTGDVSTTLEAIRDAVTAELEAQNVTEPGSFDAAYKQAMASALNPIKAKMKFDGLREAVATRINKMKSESTKVKTAENMFGQIVSIALNQAEKRARKTLLADIKKDLKAVKGQAKLNVLNVDRKISADTEHFLRMVKEVSELSLDNAEQLANEMQSDLENDVFKEKNMGETFRNKWESKFPILGSRFFGGLSFDLRLGQMLPILRQYGGLTSFGLDRLAGAAAALETRINEGAVKAGLDTKEFVETTKTISDGLLTSTASKNKRAAFRFSGRWTAPFNLRHRLLDLTRFASKAARELGEDVIDQIMDRVQRGATVRDTHVRTGLDSLAKALLEIYGGAEGFKQKVTSTLMGSKASTAMKHIDMLTQTHKEYAKYNKIDGKALSKEQLLQIVAIWEQLDIRDNLKDYDQKLIDDIKDNALNQKDLEFLDWMRDFYVQEGDALSEVTMDLFGTRANSPTENYMPVRADVKKLWSSTEVHGAPLTPPSLRDRQVHKRQMDYRVGVLSMFEDRLRRNANFIGFAKTGHMLKRIFGSEALSEQIDMVHGDAALTGLYNHLTDVVTNTKAGGWSSAILEKARGMVGLIALSGNFKVFFTQWTSLPAFALEEGLLDFSRGILNAANNPQAWVEGLKALKDSEQWKNRRALGTSEFVENALRGSLGTGAIDDIIASNDVKAAARFLKRIVSTWYKSGMVTNAMGDAVPIFLYGPAIYMQKKAEALQDGLTDEKATQRALDRTWGWIQRTQQSYSPKDQSAWIRRGGSFARIAAQFSTTPAQYLSYEMKAIRDLIANPTAKNLRQAFNVVAVNHVLLAGGYFTVATFISNMLRGDDWDEDDTMRLLMAMISGPAAGIVIGGSLVQDFLNSQATDKSTFGGSVIPMAQYMKRTGMDIGDLIKHMTYDFDLDEALEDASKLADDFSAPLRQSKQFTENVLDK